MAKTIPECCRKMIESVAGFIDRNRLLASGAGVVAGVSGGADSVAMLDVLCALAARADRGYRLTVAHLDHMLRPDARADARFVRAICRRRGLPCVIESRDVKVHAARIGGTIEQAARELRYGFLLDVALKAGAGFVAVAHHADDNVETVLHRIFRGTHLRGLAGMDASRTLKAAKESNSPEVRLVRPLLERRREEIEAYCRARRLKWRTDATNFLTRGPGGSAAFARNFIRHELLPLVRARLNLRADHAVLRLAGAAADAEELLARRGDKLLAAALRRQSADALALDTEPLANADALSRTYALRQAMELLGAPLRTLSAEHMLALANLCEPPWTPVSLPGGLTARREGDAIMIERARTPDDRSWAPVALGRPGVARLPDGRTLAYGPQRAPGAKRRRPAPGVERLDADTIEGELIVRPRRAGDAFVPLGAGGTQSVSDFLTNAKLPAARRQQVVCVCDSRGIVWLAPLRIADRVKLTPATRRVLRLRIEPPWSAPD